MEEKTANMAENIRVTFTGFHYIKDDDYPNDFEVYLLILKDNSLSAGCWDTGLYATEGGKQPGAFRQARGCFIDADYVKAWTKLEDIIFSRTALCDWDTRGKLQWTEEVIISRSFRTPWI